MKVIRNIYWSVFSPLRIFTGEFLKGRLLASNIVVLVAAFLGAFVFPALYNLDFKNRFSMTIRMESMILMFFASMLTWLGVCALFWLISRLFRKNVSYKEIASTWGYSYIPNIICIIAYNLILLRSGLILGNDISGFLLNTLFIMLLIWKAIYFFMELKYVMKTNGLELLLTTLLAGIAFILLMWAGFSVGIQVPML